MGKKLEFAKSGRHVKIARAEDDMLDAFA